jgi:hypothetical protein
LPASSVSNLRRCSSNRWRFWPGRSATASGPSLVRRPQGRERVGSAPSKTEHESRCAVGLFFRWQLS